MHLVIFGGESIEGNLFQPFQKPASPFFRNRSFFRHKGHVPHFSASPNGPFAIEMQDGPRNGHEIPVSWSSRHGSDFVADEIDHRRWAQQLGLTDWRAAEDPNLLFELRDRAGVQSVVTGIMRTGGDFIDQEIPIGRMKELDTEHSGRIERRHGLNRKVRRFRRGCGWKRGGHQSQAQDAPLMPIVHSRIRPALPAGLSNYEDRELSLKGDVLFEYPPLPGPDTRMQGG